MQKRYAVLTLVLALGFVPVAVFAETLEEVEAELTEKASKVDSFSADMNMKMAMMPGMDMTGTGTMEVLKKDGESLSRNEMTMKMKMGEQTMESKTLTIFDGEQFFVQQESFGNKIAMKTKEQDMAGSSAQFGEDLFKGLKEQFELSLEGEEKVNGKDAYVLSGKPKAGNPAVAMFSKMVHYIDKETGIPVKTVALGQNGQEMMVQTFTNIKLNPELKPERFEYTPPPGVTVMDMSDMQGMPGMGAPGAPPAPVPGN